MSLSYDIIIVGSGIVGSACAYECAKAGLRVLLIDRGLIGSGATSAGMGHIVVLDDSEEQFELSRYSRQLWTEFAEQQTDQLQWEQRGTLWIAADDEEMEIVRVKHDFYRRRHIRTEVLDSRSLVREEPNLREGLCGGLLVFDDAVLYPPTAAKCLADCAAALGAEILENSEVKKINHDGSVVLLDGSCRFAGIVINAAGCGSPELTEGIHVFKKKGHLVVTNRYPDLIRHQVIELGYLKSAHTQTTDSVAFNVQPRSDGKILIGSSRQIGENDVSVDYEILTRMLNRACDYMPMLRDIWALRSWCGFRPATPDKLPLIGPCPGFEKIWLATGHEGLGITTSLATGRLIADMILDRDSAISVKPYLPSRCTTGDVING